MEAGKVTVKYRILATVGDGEEYDIATIEGDLKLSGHVKYGTEATVTIDTKQAEDRIRRACQAFATALEAD